MLTGTTQQDNKPCGIHGGWRVVTFDPKMVLCADTGESYMEKYPDSDSTKAYEKIVKQIMEPQRLQVTVA
jgi:hypothetical protein